MARYEIGEKLGSGGMGVVYRARQLDLDRTVAIKYLSATDAESLARFRRESRLLMDLVHPNVIRLLDAGEHDGAFFIVTEFVDARDLGSLLLEGPLSVTIVASVLEQVLDALAYVHARGVVHRDVKPSNIMLDGAGRARLMDFGIAAGLNATAITADGQMLGTAPYLAPEQFFGEPASAATDLWSLGVTAYALLTAQLPFTGATIAALQRSVCNDEPTPLRELRPDLPGALELVLSRFLRKPPGARHAGADSARRSLGAALDDAAPRPTVVSVTPPRSDGRGRLTGHVLVTPRRAGPASRAPLTPPPDGSKEQPGARARLRALSPVILVGAAVGALVVWPAGSARGPRGAASVPTARAPATPRAPPGWSSHVISLIEELEARGEELRSWDVARADGRQDVPVVVTCSDHTTSARIRMESGVVADSIGGRSLPSSRDGTVDLDVRALGDGVHWLRVSGASTRRRLGTLRLRRGPCPVAVEATGSPPKGSSAWLSLQAAVFSFGVPDARAGAEAIPRLFPSATDPLRLLAVAAIDNVQAEISDTIFRMDEADDPSRVDSTKLASLRKTIEAGRLALRVHPLRWEPWYELGHALRRADQPDAARAALSQALRAWPESPYAWHQLGLAERYQASVSRDHDAKRHLAYAGRYLRLAVEALKLGPPGGYAIPGPAPVAALRDVASASASRERGRAVRSRARSIVDSLDGTQLR